MFHLKVGGGGGGGGGLIQRRRAGPETKRCLISVTPLRKEEGLYAALNTHRRPLSGESLGVGVAKSAVVCFGVRMALTEGEMRGGGAQSLASKRVRKTTFSQVSEPLFQPL